MGYVAGVDLGTTYSAAAVFAVDGLTAVDLSTQATVMPSIVAVRSGGEVVTGSNAERRLVTEPSTVAREFKRRLGDSTPILLGGTPYATADLTAFLLESIIDLITERQGGAPDLVGLSHPANYADFKLDLLRGAARKAGVGATTFVAEPVAAAVHYAQSERVADGDVIAVYDLGGGTFDASLVRRTGDGFEVIGTPDGMDRFGGIDLDEAVLGHVRRSLGGALDGLDVDDPSVVSALNRLREDCRGAKEALSGDAEAEIPVMLPGLHTEVRLTRPEFEEMIRPRVSETIRVLERTIGSADLDVSEVSRVLLVGGSSRIPLIAEMITQELGKSVSLDAHPKLTVALGTARVAHAEIAPESAVVAPVGASPSTSELVGITELARSGDETEAHPVVDAGAPEGHPAPVVGAAAAEAPTTQRQPVHTIVPPPPDRTEPSAPPPAPARSRRSDWPVIGAVAAVLVAIVVAAVVLLAVAGGDGGDDGSDSSASVSASAVEPSQVVVPRVIGRPEASARDELAGQGLDVTVEYVDVPADDEDDGYVVAQSVEANQRVDEASEITITVGRAEDAPAATDTEPPTTPPTTEPPTTTIPPTAEDQLAMLIAQDEPIVASVAENWVPQLSAKRLGIEDDGVVFGYDEILLDHEVLRRDFGAVLVDGGTYNFNLDGVQMEGWYMTIVPEPFVTPEGALTWCRDQSIGRDDCFAKFLSADPTNIDDTVELQ